MRHQGLIKLYTQLALVAMLSGLVAGSAFAASPASSPMAAMLDRTANFTTHFLEDFSNVKCTELVTQTKLGKSGKVEYRVEATFDYLLMAQSSGGELTLVESRLPGKESKHNRNLPLLVTNGFSTLLLVFHPTYQANFKFTPMEDEIVDGRRYARVHFEHIKGTRSTAVLLLRGREYPLDIEGTAWIDPEAGVIARITAGLEGSMEDVGLRSLRCEVHYEQVPFAGAQFSTWLPTTAVIDVETPRQHWRNVHRFTAYQRFSTSVESRIESKP